MPKVFTQKVDTVSGTGYISRLKFTRENFDTVLVSAALRGVDGDIPDAALTEVRLLDRDGTLLDSVALAPNGSGGRHVGVHMLTLKAATRKFQVAVYCHSAGVVSGSITALHGLTADAGELIQRSIDEAGGVPPPAAPQREVLPLLGLGGCTTVPPASRPNIPVLYRRIAVRSSYASGVVAPIDRTSCGGVQVIP